nr:unnamed protein product [Digitaria exilis]CAB3448853.1 unnamed protein product [Digitaria exilis]
MAAPPSPATALLTGERLVVFLFAARVALEAPASLAAPLAILAAAALAVELAVDGSDPASSPLRRFRTRCFIWHTSWCHYSAQRYALSANPAVKALIS